MRDGGRKWLPLRYPDDRWGRCATGKNNIGREGLGLEQEITLGVRKSAERRGGDGGASVDR